MAHGAPDHTRLAESGFAHYVDRVIRRPSAAIVAAPNWEEAVNVNIQGVFGYLWAWSDTEVLRIRITIDGTVVFLKTINELWITGFFGYCNPWDKMGCTAFSAVAGNLSYGMFYDEKWGLYIHHNLTIDIQRAAAFGTIASWGIYYKELI